MKRRNTGPRYHDVPAWTCAECDTDQAAEMCAHVFHDGTSVSTCSPECLEAYLAGRPGR